MPHAKSHPTWSAFEKESPTAFNRLLLSVGVALSLLTALLVLSSPPPFQRAKAAIYDVQLANLTTSAPSPLPIIIDIDERSLADYGQWPWPRYRIALLLAKLHRWGASVVALDMVFAEADRTSPAVLQAGLQQELQIPVSLDGIPEALRDNDQVLTNVLAKGPFVLGHFFLFEDNLQARHCIPPATTIALLSHADRPSRSRLFEAKGVLCNLPQLATAAQGSGFFNARPDNDGVFRKLPLLISYQDRLYPSLALEATLKALGIDQAVVEQTVDGFLLQLPDRSIPLDRSANLYLKYRGAGRTFPYLSASAILRDEVPPSSIDGRIVFVGSSAAGINDVSTTPTDPLMPGVELHAIVADNLLQNDPLRPPPWGLLLEAGSALIAGILFAISIIWAGPYFGAGLLVGAGGITLAASQILLDKAGLIFSPLPMIAAMIMVLTLLSTLKYWREKALTRKRFEQYQRSQEATIEGFGALAEYRDPETGGHIKRTQIFIRLLAAQLEKNKAFNGAITPEVVEVLGKAAPLHDIGKVGMPDNILLKPGQLTTDEFEAMKRHTIYGAEVIDTLKKKVGETPFLRYAGEIARSHQEKWDGSGYPDGLKGEQIPLAARLMALADVYDALISERVYKPALSHARAKQIIVEGRGTHFDPEVVAAFLQVERSFLSTALFHADTSQHRDTLLTSDGG